MPEPSPVLAEMQAEIKRLSEEMAAIRVGEYIAESGTTQSLWEYPIHDHAPEDQEVLTWIDGNSRWEPTALTDLPAFIGCRLRHSKATTATTGTWKYIYFDTESHDTDAMHVADDWKITIKTAGIYAFGGSIRWAANNTGYRQMAVFLNAGTILVADNRQAVQGETTLMGRTSVHEFAVNDYINFSGLQTSGGDLDIVSASDYSPVFWAYKIGDPTS